MSFSINTMPSAQADALDDVTGNFYVALNEHTDKFYSGMMNEQQLSIALTNSAKEGFDTITQLEGISPEDAQMLGENYQRQIAALSATPPNDNLSEGIIAQVNQISANAVGTAGEQWQQAQSIQSGFEDAAADVLAAGINIHFAEADSNLSNADLFAKMNEQSDALLEKIIPLLEDADRHEAETGIKIDHPEELVEVVAEARELMAERAAEKPNQDLSEPDNSGVQLTSKGINLPPEMG